MAQVAPPPEEKQDVKSAVAAAKVKNRRPLDAGSFMPPRVRQRGLASGPRSGLRMWCVDGL
jgi:hypothetical protein